MAGSGWAEQDYCFSIDFEPAFLPPGRFVLMKRGERVRLSITFDPDERLRELLPGASSTGHVERVTVASEVYTEFEKRLGHVCAAEQKDLVKDGILDGITVYFRFQAGATDHVFSYRCPWKSDLSESLIIEALFDLFESSFETRETVAYIERLKGYFDFGLLVKKISQSPLEYRLYSHLSANEATEFWRFLDGLPSDRPVIFDLTNFEGMGTMFYEAIRHFLDRNPSVYWLVNRLSVRHVIEIGVKPDRIFRNRSELVGSLKPH